MSENQTIDRPDVSRETERIPEPAKLWRNEYRLHAPIFFIDEVEFEGWALPGTHLGRGEWKTQQIAETKALELCDPSNMPCGLCGGYHDGHEMQWVRAIPMTAA